MFPPNTRRGSGPVDQDGESSRSDEFGDLMQCCTQVRYMMQHHDADDEIVLSCHLGQVSLFERDVRRSELLSGDINQWLTKVDPPHMGVTCCKQGSRFARISRFSA